MKTGGLLTTGDRIALGRIGLTLIAIGIALGQLKDSHNTTLRQMESSSETASKQMEASNQYAKVQNWLLIRKPAHLDARPYNAGWAHSMLAGRTPDEADTVSTAERLTA